MPRTGFWNGICTVRQGEHELCLMPPLSQGRVLSQTCSLIDLPFLIRHGPLRYPRRIPSSLMQHRTVTLGKCSWNPYFQVLAGTGGPPDTKKGSRTFGHMPSCRISSKITSEHRLTKLVVGSVAHLCSNVARMGMIPGRTPPRRHLLAPALGLCFWHPEGCLLFKTRLY
jgi:hypothetical protein